MKMLAVVGIVIVAFAILYGRLSKATLLGRIRGCGGMLNVTNCNTEFL